MKTNALILTLCVLLSTHLHATEPPMEIMGKPANRMASNLLHQPMMIPFC